MMKGFALHAAEGRQCVLLYCGDFDPAGLQISTFMHSNLKELTGAVNKELAEEEIPDWNPDNLIIDRFGLTYDFINEARLSWLPNLATSGNGPPLDDTRHKQHCHQHVQDYLKNYCPAWSPPLTPFTRSPGARKCEANALVVRPKLARKLYLRTILKYLSPRHPQRYRSILAPHREELRKEIMTYGYRRATHDSAGRYLIRPAPNSNRPDWS
jgi:hypothetical protein